MPEMKPLPCPLCGEWPVVNPDTDHVICCKIVADDITAWNALPRALTWTHEPPVVAGDYYYRSRLDAEDTWSIPRVIPLPEGYFEHIKYNENWQWAGPIAPPVEG